ncbi:hypothetical protein GDO81_005609 [Engystomops pustulosus]|uniref:Uncharacterized protein n=1 Tax=Engystomops pustulosus TaxID=76066 RepID=A0AAV7CR15_ENGPU|nr:hypothetical protein GDO81_005609 [Engystomops pustulosus]
MASMKPWMRALRGLALRAPRIRPAGALLIALLLPPLLAMSSGIRKEARPQANLHKDTRDGLCLLCVLGPARLWRHPAPCMCPSAGLYQLFLPSSPLLIRAAG